ncbi:MAG: alpha/beta hydrolase [Hyphomicrobium sp.]|nr:alpha/beta hydrolase [Hyphomicrobium sp.]
MRSFFRSVASSFVLLIGAAAAHAQVPLKLTAADGVTVYGNTYAATVPAKATVLLFHQAASNAGEYSSIAPMLVKMGYDVIAIDQRSGGVRFGQSNQTVKALGGSSDYLDALPDLEAALAHARKTAPDKPVIIWGSSYSAALVFLLAAQHPSDVAAVLAFSPGEYLGRASVADAAHKIKAPVFVTSASDDGEIQAAKAILAATSANVRDQYIPKSGVHGSSTLREDSNPSGAAAGWAAVTAFLAKLPSK